MMEKIIINVEKSTRMVSLTKTTIGNDLENLQQELVFKFTDSFVDGEARLDYKVGNNAYHIPMTKEGETYTVPIKNVITKEGRIEMQLVIVQTAQDEEIPLFKSNVFYMFCNKSINAQEEAPDSYEYWLDVIEEKLAEVNNLNISAERVSDGVNITIIDKQGESTTTKVNDGVKGDTGDIGPTGDDGFSPIANVTKVGNTATITITDKTGTTTATISDGEGGGTYDYEDSENKPSINNVTLSGNKTTSDLGLFSGDYDDLDNKPNLNSFKNVYYIWHADLSNATKKQTIIAELQEILTNIVNDENNLEKSLVIIYEDLQQKTILTGRVNDFANENDTGFLTFEIKDRRLYAYQDTTSFYNIRINYSNRVITDVRKTSPSINDYYKPLTVTNTKAFTPTGDYHPATKKYVDDAIASAITDALGGSY